MKFQAAVLTALDAPLTIGDVESDPLEYGQVLVRVLVSGICGAQLQEIRGEKGNASYIPHLLGHEGCGVVEEVGPGVTSVDVGNKVVLHWRPGSGVESGFPSYTFDGRLISSGKVTTFSEYSVVSENRITRVPHETPNELCALLGCGLSTALGTIENEANLLMGESILVVGCGGLGLNLIRVARMRLAGTIHALDISERKAISSTDAGADVFGVSFEDFNDMQYDVIVDTTGNPHAIADAIILLAPSGRFIMVGQPGPKQGIMLHGARHLFDGTGKVIKATQGGAFQPSLHIPRYVGLWKSGQLKLDGVISHRLPLAQINDGIELVKNGLAGRVLLEMV
jgi:S-(hydroxymethyl)glutathione dehydrogenase/alcohol dehydrogenase